MAYPSYTYTLTNGTTADASQVMQNLNDILNGVTDGTKDLSIAALTVAGTATLNGNVAIGNASGDELTITASLASSVPIKTNNSYDIGSATLGLRKLYLGNAGAGATCDIVAASHATTREYTIPDCSAAASFVMTQGTQTISGSKTFDGQLIGKGTVANDDASSGYIGEYKEQKNSSQNWHASGTWADLASMTLTAGDWDVWGEVNWMGVGTTLSGGLIDLEAAILGASGSSTTGIVFGHNASIIYQVGIGGSGQISLSTPIVRVTSDGTHLYSLGTTTSSSQVIRLKAQLASWSGTTPQYNSILRARRVR